MPGILFAIACHLAAAAPSEPLQLAAELFAEGQWEAARVESLRAQEAAALSPAEAARARLLAARALIRSTPNACPQAKANLEKVWQNESAAPDDRCMAAYELALARREDRETPAVFDPLRYAFLNARDVPLFWRAGCTLYFHLKADKRLRRAEPALWQTLQSCRDAWPLEIWRECRPRKTRSNSLASLPGRAVVGFYRTLIGPAIGSRCDLQPSCSEYFLHASRAHGLLGIPIMADRFIREPSVVSSQHQPVTMPDGRIRFADPLSDHDFWMKGNR